MKETIFTRAESDRRQVELDIDAGRLGFGTMWLIQRRTWILRRYIKVCRERGTPAGFEAFSMLANFELLRQRFIDSLKREIG